MLSERQIISDQGAEHRADTVLARPIIVVRVSDVLNYCDTIRRHCPGVGSRLDAQALGPFSSTLDHSKPEALMHVCSQQTRKHRSPVWHAVVKKVRRHWKYP